MAVTCALQGTALAFDDSDAVQLEITVGLLRAQLLRRDEQQRLVQGAGEAPGSRGGRRTSSIKASRVTYVAYVAYAACVAYVAHVARACESWTITA